MYAGNSSAGSTPCSRTSSVVYVDTVRTASAFRSAIDASVSAAGRTSRRRGEP